MRSIAVTEWSINIDQKLRPIGNLKQHSRTAGSCSHTRRRVPHISLVFREMWDTTDVDR